MKSKISFGLLAVALVIGVSAAANAQPTVYNWIATDDVADWNVGENWDAPAGNFVPNADEFGGESALINNGRTALANVKVPRVAGLQVLNGGVDIPADGIVETIVDSDNNGGLSIGGAGRINVSGNGQLTIAGGTTNAGSLRITGPSAQVTFGDGFSTMGTLVAGITGDNHSIIDVDGTATLGGQLQVEINGVTPAFGQSWGLLSADSLEGNFRNVDASSSPPLARGLQYQVTQDNGTASLLVGNALVATVDRQTGVGKIENVVGAPVEITSYALRSESGLLSAENWSSVANSGVAGPGWTVANPTVNHLAELNLANSFNLEVGASFDLGNPYNGGPVQVGDEDVIFEYTTADGRLDRGIVEYTGALNDLVLHVNPDDGAGAIANLSRFIDTPDITSYAVRSESGALTVDTWNGFGDSGQAGEGWVEANPSSEHIAELNLENSKTFPNGTLISLGNIFAAGSEQDLLFQYTTLAGELLQGTVQYGEIPMPNLPGDCNGDGIVNGADVDCVCAMGGDLGEVLGIIGSLPGDADFDGQVQFTDLVILSDNFGTSGPYSEGDFDCDGTVQFGDLVILSDNFGKSAGATAATVPEPSAVALQVIALLALSGLRRWRKQS